MSGFKKNITPEQLPKHSPLLLHSCVYSPRLSLHHPLPSDLLESHFLVFIPRSHNVILKCCMNIQVHSITEYICQDMGENHKIHNMGAQDKDFVWNWFDNIVSRAFPVSVADQGSIPGPWSLTGGIPELEHKTTGHYWVWPKAKANQTKSCNIYVYITYTHNIYKCRYNISIYT